MNDAEFDRLANAALQEIERRLEASGADLDFELKGCIGGMGPPVKWPMRLVLKKSEIDKDDSDYDGDGTKNGAEPAPGTTPQEKEQNKKKNMFDPAKK